MVNGVTLSNLPVTWSLLSGAPYLLPWVISLMHFGPRVVYDQIGRRLVHSSLTVQLHLHFRVLVSPPVSVTAKKPDPERIMSPNSSKTPPAGIARTPIASKDASEFLRLNSVKAKFSFLTPL